MSGSGRFQALRFGNIASPVGGLLLVGLVFRCVIAYFLPAGFDEAYYFLYTQHLSWSYFDHPVAVSLTTGVGVWLFDSASPLALRAGALSLFTLSLWLLYKTGRWLFGDRAATLSLVVASLSPLFILTFGTLAAPDNALIFFWSAALYVCAREFFPVRSLYIPTYRPTPRLAIISLLLGLCCLSKYHGFLLGLSLVCFCLGSPVHRSALRSKWMGFGLVLFLLCLVPVLYWNAQHDWISFQFQLIDRFATPSRVGLPKFSLLNLLGVVLAGVGFLFPTLGLPLWWVSFRSLISGFFSRRFFSSRFFSRQSGSLQSSSKVCFVLWTGLPTAIGFTLLGGMTHTYPAWPAPGLWSLTLLLGHFAAAWPRSLVRRWLVSTALVIGVILMFALTHIALGTLQKTGQYSILGGVLSPQQDPSTALIDTRQLQEKFAYSDEFREAIAQASFIITHEFWLSGYVAMSLPAGMSQTVGCFSQDPRGHALWTDSSLWVGEDALFVSIADFDQTKVLGAIAPYFQSITPVTTLTTTRGGAVTETFYLYQARNLLRPYAYPY